ncbi:hypothetical protein VNO78_34357 [Psophocarpus tetragonolobus]|uniref:Protein kinase domain-containing protein n=1 Tax=Psophocarpus tetragonolobus TaxID=3891 RepID=A0AAN9RS09_PSOTE
MEGGDHQYSSGANKAKFYKSAPKRMGNKKLLVVLDDIDTSEQIKYLVGKPICFGERRRVIITIRYKHVLKSGGVGQIYEAMLMDPRDSLKLFCLNAFDGNQPEKGYEKLSKEVVKVAGDNPLALTVLGADFHSRRTIKSWECALSKIKKYPIQKIQRVLRYGYDELHDVEKEAFLDIAFFYKEEDKDYVIRELDAYGFHGTSAIDILQQKALITISNDNKIHMHELIGEMGLEIVRQESTKYPEGRSRLKDREDVNKVLSKKRETDKVEAIEIDSSQIATLSSQADILKNMSSLRLLKINYPLHLSFLCHQAMFKDCFSHIKRSKTTEHNSLCNGNIELRNLEGSDVDKNVPDQLLCLRASYYLKLSKGMGRDNGKPKLRILFDGLKFSQLISLDKLYYSVTLSDFGLAITYGSQSKKNINLSGTMRYVAPGYLLDGRKPVEKLAPAHGICTKSSNVYLLRGLLEEDSISLFVKLAFKEGKEKKYPQLLEIEREILKKCRGIPLAVKTLGSSLISRFDRKKSGSR